VIWLDALVCLLMVVVAVTATAVRNLVSAVILVGVVSLLVSYLFLRMGAPDVAMTEASIGAALTTVVFLVALRRTGDDR